MSKSNVMSKGLGASSFFIAQNSAAKDLATKWKQKVVPVVLFIEGTGDEVDCIPTLLRRSGRSWQHTLNDTLNEIYPIKARRASRLRSKKI